MLVRISLLLGVELLHQSANLVAIRTRLPEECRNQRAVVVAELGRIALRTFQRDDGTVVVGLVLGVAHCNHFPLRSRRIFSVWQSEARTSVEADSGEIHPLRWPSGAVALFPPRERPQSWGLTGTPHGDIFRIANDRLREPSP